MFAVMYYLLICRSLTYAQRAVRELERTGITATVTRVPQSIDIEGCGYCVKIAERHFARALDILRATEIYPKKIFIQYDDGVCVEVAV